MTRVWPVNRRVDDAKWGHSGMHKRTAGLAVASDIPVTEEVLAVKTPEQTTAIEESDDDRPMVAQNKLIVRKLFDWLQSAFVESE